MKKLGFLCDHKNGRPCISVLQKNFINVVWSTKVPIVSVEASTPPPHTHTLVPPLWKLQHVSLSESKENPANHLKRHVITPLSGCSCSHKQTDYPKSDKQRVAQHFSWCFFSFLFFFSLNFKAVIATLFQVRRGDEMCSQTWFHKG